MLKTKEFKGNINKTGIEDDLNAFVKELSAESVVDIKYNSNIANIKKADGSTDLIVLTSALVIYDD
jgi:hypothetical protein